MEIALDNFVSYCKSLFTMKDMTLKDHYIDVANTQIAESKMTDIFKLEKMEKRTPQIGPQKKELQWADAEGLTPIEGFDTDLDIDEIFMVPWFNFKDYVTKIYRGQVKLEPKALRKLVEENTIQPNGGSPAKSERGVTEFDQRLGNLDQYLRSEPPDASEASKKSHRSFLKSLVKQTGIHIKDVTVDGTRIANVLANEEVALDTKVDLLTHLQPFVNKFKFTEESLETAYGENLEGLNFQDRRLKEINSPQSTRKKKRKGGSGSSSKKRTPVITRASSDEDLDSNLSDGDSDIAPPAKRQKKSNDSNKNGGDGTVTQSESSASNAAPAKKPAGSKAKKSKTQNKAKTNKKGKSKNSAGKKQKGGKHDQNNATTTSGTPRALRSAGRAADEDNDSEHTDGNAST